MERSLTSKMSVLMAFVSIAIMLSPMALAQRPGEGGSVVYSITPNYSGSSLAWQDTDNFALDAPVWHTNFNTNIATSESSGHFSMFTLAYGAAAIYAEAGELVMGKDTGYQYTAQSNGYKTVNICWHLKYWAFAATLPENGAVPMGNEARNRVEIHSQVIRANDWFAYPADPNVIVAYNAGSVMGIDSKSDYRDQWFTATITFYSIAGTTYFFNSHVYVESFTESFILGAALLEFDMAPDGGDGRGAWITGITVMTA